MNRLQNKVALVTGGTTGIGLAAAQLFQQEGARVIVTGRNPQTLAAARAALPGADVVASDASSLADINALAEHIQKTYGKLDVVFANAGIVKFAPLGHATEEVFDLLLDTNFKGAFFLIQAVTPLLSEGASIVLNSSVNASRAPEAGALYGASKAALSALARNLAHAEAFISKRIRINTISPGPIETPMWTPDKTGLPAEALEGFAQSLTGSLALRRFGKDTEIAKTALFLASDDASYLTGTELVVDGGFTAKF